MNEDNIDGIAKAEISASLARIIANKPFSASPQASAMLKHMVNETLAGKGQELKAYTIGVDALGKQQDFDAQIDPSVRVLARSVRQGLIEYYAIEGKYDSVRIDIPTGSYRPRFVRSSLTNSHEGKATEIPRRFRFIHLITVVAFLIVALVSFLSFNKNNDGLPNVARFEGPRVLILPFAYDKEPPPKTPTRELAVGITNELVNDMARYPWLSVVQLPEENAAVNSLSQIATAENPPHYILTGFASESGNSVLVSVKLQSFPTLKIIWTKTFNEPQDRPDFDRLHYEISTRIAAVVGSDRGIVPDLLKSDPPPSLSLDVEAFRCFMDIYPYWRDPEDGRRNHLEKCLTESVTKNPGYAEAWAALASIYLDRAREDADKPDLFAKAGIAIDKALAIAPLNPVVLRVAMTWSLYKPNSELKEFERYARKELTIRPNNPDTLAEIGTRFAVNIGKWDEGLELVAKAVDLNPKPPAWYYLAPALRSLVLDRNGEVPEPLKNANAPDSIAINLINAISAVRGRSPDLLNSYRSNLNKLGLTDVDTTREYIKLNRLEPNLDRILNESAALIYANETVE